MKFLIPLALAVAFALGTCYGVLQTLHLVTSGCDESGGFKFRGKIYTCQPEPVRKVQGVIL